MYLLIIRSILYDLLRLNTNFYNYVIYYDERIGKNH